MNDTDLSRKPWLSDYFTLDPHLAKVPTLLTPEECRMLAWVTQHYYDGSGFVCDLGAFTGGSAAHLASGVRKSGKEKPGVVHSYDFFEIDEMRKQKHLYRHGVPEFAGSDMLPVVRELLKPYEPIVDYHKGDITRAKWNCGEISVLFVDVSKSYDINRYLLGEFFPFLVPGRSILIQQDYLYHANPWVMATMEALEDSFELLGWTEFHSVIFGCRKVCDAATAMQVCDSLRAPGEMSRLLRKAMVRFPYTRQREVVAKSILVYESNPTIEKAWQFPAANYSAGEIALLTRG